VSEEPERIIRNDSGAQTLIGYEIRIFADRTEAILPLEERHLNRQGFLHGGLFALLLDSCCGYAASRAMKDDASQKVVTLNLQTNYLAPGSGKLVKATGKVTKAGRSIIFADGHVCDEHGTILVTGNCTFKAVRS